ncbi:MAG: 50S ribosomal protein L21 [Candidatus Beckwithbacteria bacterium]|nr:50S ribosomal protein L21 [Candidatus Beckwithbacteria bacterium]
MKYAVIKTGGQQLKVIEGETLTIAKLAGKPKEKISFKEVLLVVNDQKVSLGQPLVKGASVSAEIVNQKKDKKIRVVKFKAKSRYRRVRGHRQEITTVKIVKITL